MKARMTSAFAIAVLVMATLTAIGQPSLVIPAGIVTLVVMSAIFGVFRKQEVPIDD